MQPYNDKEYEAMMEVLIKDTFYESSSYDTKIHLIRKYTEIIIRRLTNYRCDYLLMLGHKNTTADLIKNGVPNSDKFFWDSLQVINKKGNDRTHTQKTILATEEEYNRVVDSLFNLYAYLFIRFFRQYPFGSNPAIVTAFSILPPIIRYKALNELYKEDPGNEVIVEKLVLSILKAFDKKSAIEWIEKHKEDLLAMQQSIPSEQKAAFIAKFGPEYAEVIMQSLTDNYYNILNQKVEQLEKVFERRGVLYKDFEGAVSYYRNNGIVDGDSQEIRDFNALMEFVYVGRKEREKELTRIANTDYMLDRVVFFVKPEY